MAEEKHVAKFVIPGFWQFEGLNHDMVVLKGIHPEWFRDDVKIEAIYDTFPYTTIGGGRSDVKHKWFNDYRYFIEFMNKFSFYNEKGISMRFTYTNFFINDNDLSDNLNNTYLNLFNKEGNDIIISSDKLEGYIREKYKNYGFISSTTKCLSHEETIKELEKDYKYVVLNYNFNNNWDIIDSLPHHEKLEVMVNEYCVLNCPHRKMHYQGYCSAQKGEKEFNMECIYKKDDGTMDNVGFYKAMTFPSFISNEMIRNEYLPRGIDTFKIVGRNVSEFDTVEAYGYYLIKEEYREVAKRCLYEMAHTDLVESMVEMYMAHDVNELIDHNLWVLCRDRG